jgi:UDPglucose 6-dehydrogenase
MKDHFGDLHGKVIGVLGLTYKPRTDTLRRSQAIELCRMLMEEGCRVRAYDPTVSQLPDTEIAPTTASAIRGADAVVLCTEWPEFRDLPWRELLATMRQPCVFDANRFLHSALGSEKNLHYFSVGQCT